MKYFLFIISLFYFSIQITVAQDPPRPDTVWGNWPNQSFLNSILKAPVVSGETEAITIVPTVGPFCFDKKIQIKSTSGSYFFEQCLYLDTKNGLVAYLKPVRNTSSEMCDIKPDDKDFFFSVVGLKGNVYNYQNTENNGRIEHWVMTGNTQTHTYQSPTTNNGTYTLRNKHIRKGFCDDKIKATSYKYDMDGSPELYVFGKTYPENINVTSNKYIGSLGIGYQYTEMGLYIIMEILSNSYTTKITSIEEVDVCFDPNPFRVMEDQFLEKRRAELQKEREKIERDESKIKNNDVCAPFSRNIIVFRRAQLRLQEEGLGIIPQGNAYQNQNVQTAYMNMMDPLFMVQGNILETQLSICRTEEALRNNRSSNATESKLSCLRILLTKLYAAETQMSELDALYATAPAKAMGEKSRLYLLLMREMCE